MALLAAPLLAIIDHSLVPGPLMICGFAVSFLTVVSTWRSIDFARMPAVLPSLFVGSWIAARLLFTLPPDVLSLALGAIVLAAVALSVFAKPVQPTRTNVAIAGLAAGFLSTAASIPGPPLAMVYQESSPERMRATLSAIFTCTGLVSLWNLRDVGKFGTAELELALWLAPAALAGFALAHLTAGKLPKALMRAGVMVLSASAGATLVVQGLWTR